MVDFIGSLLHPRSLWRIPNLQTWRDNGSSINDAAARKNVPTNNFIHPLLTPLCLGVCSYQSELLDDSTNTSNEPIPIENDVIVNMDSLDGQPFVGSLPLQARVSSHSRVADCHPQWAKSSPSFRQLLRYYSKLSKLQLTLFVVSTSVAGYYVTPSTTLDGGLETMLSMALGTFLCSASASALNQFFEIPYDSQMVRTKERPLVRGDMHPFSALTFACLSAIAGTSLLYARANLETALLGGANIVLYAGAYTFSKRYSILNTWIGAIVGAIPPLMGATARAGGLTRSCAGGLAVSTLLYAWQFPHFNALSWKYKSEYARAGYKMMSVTDPMLCRRVAWHYALLLAGPITVAIDVSMNLRWTYLASSTLLVNSGLLLLSWKFYRDPNATTAKRLFLYSLWHLIGSLTIVVACKCLHDHGHVVADEAPGQLVAVSGAVVSAVSACQRQIERVYSSLFL